MNANRLKFGSLCKQLEEEQFLPCLQLFLEQAVEVMFVHQKVLESHTNTNNENESRAIAEKGQKKGETEEALESKSTAFYHVRKHSKLKSCGLYSFIGYLCGRGEAQKEHLD